MTSTLFKHVSYDLGHLVGSIEMGQIGLPDIQRPFVWPNTKVRDLFDSMYRGYPVGYLLFWQNGFDGGGRQIGTDEKQKVPDLLIVDGQQRLTSMFAVVRGIEVLRKDYSKESIEIAFNPLLGRFEVPDAAVRKDPAYIPNISVLWRSGASLFRIVADYLEGLRKAREVSAEEQDRVETAITAVYNLLKFPFTALELSRDVDEEQVAEVFVRINSQGKSLNQGDFILTLMSVFWDEGRTELEAFCRDARIPSKGDASSYNHFIEPDPDQLLRVSIALGFRRARLQTMYSILRGKDLDTGDFSPERREQQFEILKEAQSRVLELGSWHGFFQAIRLAGYVGGRMITSDFNLLFSYVFYLIGKTEYRVPEKELRRVIARWFSMCNLTRRYTGSSESALEYDLNRLREIHDAPAFVAMLDGICADSLTSDFWSIQLPNRLAVATANTPVLHAYHAALILEGARALFSDQSVLDLLDPSVHSTRRLAEKHHLFPKKHLATIGVTQQWETNQLANYALLEWGDNAAISADAPTEYLPVMIANMDKEEVLRQYRWHCLPDGWESMAYREFLSARRERIASFIQEASRRLEDGAELVVTPLDMEELIRGGEGTQVEFKSTLRINLHTGDKDPRMEHSCLKTIAGFLNGSGGTLIIGVSDEGETIGIATDGFPNEDKMHLHLDNLIRSRMGATHMMYLHPRFEDRDEKRVLVIECWKANSPVFLKDGNDERFYVRTGASTSELPPSQTQDYIRKRFPNR